LTNRDPNGTSNNIYNRTSEIGGGKNNNNNNNINNNNMIVLMEQDEQQTNETQGMSNNQLHYQI